ncbi:hypothetical protein B296_00046136 [Ensete ventricosum]|uniref:Uncharacterized protein n=1 Tax=Ensete ventricosum TaxID=4639 RepID=A0A426XF69_ENSVE|nr:hypothetical protein B296_00046136 [Ensete ventricosum]
MLFMLSPLSSSHHLQLKPGNSDLAMASLVLILVELLRPEKAKLLTAANCPPSARFSRDVVAATAAAGAAASGRGRSDRYRWARSSSETDSSGDASEEDPTEAKVSVESIWF